MELFESGNGVRAHLCWSSCSLGSCDLYSIDEIRRGYARPTRNYRLELELPEALHTGFSDLTNVCLAEHPENTMSFWAHFCEICDFKPWTPVTRWGQHQPTLMCRWMYLQCIWSWFVHLPRTMLSETVIFIKKSLASPHSYGKCVFAWC